MGDRILRRLANKSYALTTKQECDHEEYSYQRPHGHVNEHLTPSGDSQIVTRFLTLKIEPG